MGQLVVNGLALGSIYALVALGLLLIFNTVQIVNFAQGQLLMLGAFIGISCAVTHELPIALAWAATRVKITRAGDGDGRLIMFAGEMREHPHEGETR